MHRLLKRQLKRIYGKEVDLKSLDDKVKELLLDVSKSYKDYEKDGLFIEHALELSSEELYVANNRLREINDTLEHKVAAEVKKNREKDLLLLEHSRHAQMGEMIAMIAHQWRQPLAAIAALTSFLQIQNSLHEYDGEVYDEHLRKISDCTLHLSETIKDFREFFKEDKELTEATLSEVIDESLDLVTPLLSDKGVDLQKTYSFNENICTYINELKQVILILIKNAQDVIEERNIKNGRIEIKTCADDLSCYIEIKDNAGGIQEEILEKIFEPYFTTKSSLNGTGLGLYMAKMIIQENCQGEINAKNVADGACFTIRLKKYAR